jgi:hypothetical protein
MMTTEAKATRDSPTRSTAGLRQNVRVTTANIISEPTAGKISEPMERKGPGIVRDLVTRRKAESTICVAQTQRHGEVRTGEKQNRTKKLSKAKARISGRSTSIRNKAEAVISMAIGENWLG